MKKWIIGIIIVIVVVIVIFCLGGGGIPVHVAAARKGMIRAYVEERAKTTLPRVYRMTMPLSGRIMPILLDEGTEVKEGQLIARLDTADLNTRITESKARIEVIDGKIKIGKYNAMEKTALKESDDWIKTMQSAVLASEKKAMASKARNQFAQWYLESTRKMQQAISTKEINQAQMQAAEAQVDYEADLLYYHSMDTVLSIFKLCPIYINQFLFRKHMDVEVLQSELKETDAALKKAQRDLARTSIISPISGVVLKRYVQNEKVMPAGSPLLDVGSLKDLQVTANILTEEAVDIRPGNPVDIFGIGSGDATIKGKVLRVKPEAFTKVSSLGVEQQRVPVVISVLPGELEKLEKSGAGLKLGYRVQVRIYTAEAQNALTIPRTAVFKDNDSKWCVFEAKGSSAVFKQIETGIMNYQDVQVEKGLAGKTLVITAPPTSLRDGSKISYTAPSSGKQ